MSDIVDAIVIPVDSVQLALDVAADAARAEASAARTAAREALLTKLGITADEAQLLLGS